MILLGLRHVLRLVDNFDRGNISAIRLIVREIDVVRQEEVHESVLLVRWQLCKDERLHIGVINSCLLERRLAARGLPQLGTCFT